MGKFNYGQVYSHRNSVLLGEHDSDMADNHKLDIEDDFMPDSESVHCSYKTFIVKIKCSQQSI